MAVTSLIFLPYPVVRERRVLHALTLADGVGVDDVNRPVAALDHRRVVVAAPGRMLLQVASPLPGLALVLGEGYGQAVAARDRVVVHQQRMPVGQPHAVESG